MDVDTAHALLSTLSQALRQKRVPIALAFAAETGELQQAWNAAQDPEHLVAVLFCISSKEVFFDQICNTLHNLGYTLKMYGQYCRVYPHSVHTTPDPAEACLQIRVRVPTAPTLQEIMARCAINPSGN